MPLARDPSGKPRELQLDADGRLLVSGGGSGGGSSGPDRELVVATYRARSAFAGASVGDTITATQVLDVSGGAPVTVATIWRNQTSEVDLGGAPAAADLELMGAQGLTAAQLAVAGLASEATLAQLRDRLPSVANTRGAGAADASTLRVTLASDSPAVAPLGATDDAAAASDGSGNYGLIAALKRGLLNWAALLARVPALVNGRLPVDGSAVTQPVSAAALPLPAGAATDATLTQVRDRLPSTANTRGAGATDASTQRVTLASDSPGVAPLGAQADAAAAADGTGNYGVIAALKRGLLNWNTLLTRVPAGLTPGYLPVDAMGMPGVSRVQATTSAAATVILTASCRRVSMYATQGAWFSISGAASATSHYIAAGERLDFNVPSSTTLSVLRETTDGSIRITELL